MNTVFTKQIISNQVSFDVMELKGSIDKYSVMARFTFKTKENKIKLDRLKESLFKPVYDTLFNLGLIRLKKGRMLLDKDLVLFINRVFKFNWGANRFIWDLQTYIDNGNKVEGVSYGGFYKNPTNRMVVKDNGLFGIMTILTTDKDLMFCKKSIF